MKRLSIPFFAVLCSCSHMAEVPMLAPAEPVIEYRDRDVPVAQKCVPDTVDRAAPKYGDTKQAILDAPNVRERVRIVVEANIALHKRNDVLEQVLKGCD